MGLEAVETVGSILSSIPELEVEACLFGLISSEACVDR